MFIDVNTLTVNSGSSQAILSGSPDESKEQLANIAINMLNHCVIVTGNKNECI